MSQQATPNNTTILGVVDNLIYGFQKIFMTCVSDEELDYTTKENKRKINSKKKKRKRTEQEDDTSSRHCWRQSITTSCQ
jgi:hypothetical protein